MFRYKVARIRPEYVPPDPADRLLQKPAEQVQFDLWFPHEPLPLGNGPEGTMRDDVGILRVRSFKDGQLGDSPHGGVIGQGICSELRVLSVLF